MSHAASSSRVQKADCPISPKRKKLNDMIIPLSTSKFSDIIQADSFVDKSILIREVLNIEDKDSYLVTAPRRFGKSINADMLMTFLTIEVDEFGNRKTKSGKSEPVRDTDNYHLFVNDIPKIPNRKLKISDEKKIIDEHLGKYPVIYVNFNCGQVSSFEAVLENSRQRIHETYLQHKYLPTSSKLDDDEKEDCRKWCNKHEHELFTQVNVESSLRNLSLYLFKHFEHRCFVIIDEYDSICCTAMVGINENLLAENLLENIITFFLTILDRVLKQNETYVRSGFITGISYMCTTGLSKFNNIDAYKFLQNEKFSPYYGLTLDEIEDLMIRFSILPEKKDEILSYYNGYSCCENKILSIWSIMHYLKKNDLRNYWSESSAVTHIEESLKADVVKFALLELVADTSKSMTVTDVGKLTVKKVLELKKIMHNPDIDLVNPDLYFCFLLEHGYFSVSRMYTNEFDQVIMDLSIPNREIRSEFKAKLREFYGSKYINLDLKLVDKSAYYWNKIEFSVEKNIRKNLEEICKLLNAIFKKVHFETKNEASFHHIMFVILLCTKFKCSSEALCLKYLNQGKLDILLIFNDCCIILELKYNRTCECALRDIINRNYCDIFEKNVNLSINHYLLIGANMSTDKIISMCCLIDNKDIENKMITF